MVDELEKVPGETGIPSANDEKRGTSKSIKTVFLLMCFLILLGMVYGLFLKPKETEAGSRQNDDTGQLTNTLPQRSFSLPEQPKPVVVEPIAIQPMATPQVQPLPVQVEPEKRVERQPIIRSSSPLFSAKASESSGVAAQAQPAQANQSNYRFPYAENESDAGSSSRSLSSHLTSVQTEGSRAQVFRNRDFLLTKGSFINCVMQTRLDSTQPGMSSCRVTRDIFSHNGKVLLIEKGSLITGEYQSGIQQGQARIFVLWNRIVTPNGVAINLDSPGTDSLGGSGIPGEVNTHFWKRFGGAILLSLIGDAGEWAVNTANDSEWSINSSSSTAENMASEALKNSINIPPTLYVHHGTEIGIFVARDLDFSSVYQLKYSR